MEKCRIMFMSFEDLTPDIIDSYDIKLHITRYIKKGINNNFVHVPQLAPSEELFSKAMYKWKKLKFTKKELEEMRAGKTKTWFDIYEKAFIEEMNSREDFKKAYDRIKFHLDNGKNILAVCYCSDYNRCHRFIICNKLKEEGYNAECI